MHEQFPLGLGDHRGKKFGFPATFVLHRFFLLRLISHNLLKTQIPVLFGPAFQTHLVRLTKFLFFILSYIFWWSGYYSHQFFRIPVFQDNSSINSNLCGGESPCTSWSQKQRTGLYEDAETVNFELKVADLPYLLPPDCQIRRKCLGFANPRQAGRNPRRAGSGNCY